MKQIAVLVLQMLLVVQEAVVVAAVVVWMAKERRCTDLVLVSLHPQIRQDERQEENAREGWGAKQILGYCEENEANNTQNQMRKRAIE